MIILEWILPLQLQKTKRTITDSEQLKKEVAYHTYQTDILLQQNEKLIQEAGEHVRSLHLAKELEEELARRNHIYQKTTRILVFKLQELQDGRKEQTEKEKKDSEELQELLKRAEQLKTPPQPEHQRGSINAKGRACEDAIKFLYACLEDIELERIAHTPVQNLELRYIAQHDQMMTTCQIAILVAFFYAGSLHCQHDFYHKCLLADSKTFLSSFSTCIFSSAVWAGLHTLWTQKPNMLFFSTCFFYVILAFYIITSEPMFSGYLV
jgi:hypothetical protein